MTIDAIKLNISATISDYKRDKKISIPEKVTQCRNISYGKFGKHNLLDVYYPEATFTPLPTIVNIHGGGYVYGSKEIYRRYCMYLAQQGFAVVNFNYRLAPRWKFPTPLLDTNTVMQWICENASTYYLDPKNIIIVGDSAGAQLTSQYSAIATNANYASHFGITAPSIKIRAIGLNCGMYDLIQVSGKTPSGVIKDYCGSRVNISDPRMDVLGAISTNYPPAFITTSCHDFLHDAAEPMYNYLISKGLTAEWKCYGTADQEDVAHVFHINIVHPEAVSCNEDSCTFFRKFLK